VEEVQVEDNGLVRVVEWNVDFQKFEVSNCRYESKRFCVCRCCILREAVSCVQSPELCCWWCEEGRESVAQFFSNILVCATQALTSMIPHNLPLQNLRLVGSEILCGWSVH